jgi:hypothetical protein
MAVLSTNFICLTVESHIMAGRVDPAGVFLFGRFV